MTPEEAEKIAASAGLPFTALVEGAFMQTAIALPARLATIMENQNKILSLLTGNSIQDIEEETEELLARKIEEANQRYLNWVANNIK